MSEIKTLWRIGVDVPSCEAHDLSGKGAEISGGRWNRVGTPMVYCSSTRALAYLEAIFYLAKHPLRLKRYLVEIAVPISAWRDAKEFDKSILVGWNACPAEKASIDWGTEWVNRRTSLIARVPSAIVPEEFNFLINPMHPDINLVNVKKARELMSDI